MHVYEKLRIINAKYLLLNLIQVLSEFSIELTVKELLYLTTIIDHLQINKLTNVTARDINLYCSDIPNLGLEGLINKLVDKKIITITLVKLTSVSENQNLYCFDQTFLTKIIKAVDDRLNSCYTYAGLDKLLNNSGYLFPYLGKFDISVECVYILLVMYYHYIETKKSKISVVKLLTDHKVSFSHLLELYSYSSSSEKPLLLKNKSKNFGRYDLPLIITLSIDARKLMNTILSTNIHNKES